MKARLVFVIVLALGAAVLAQPAELVQADGAGWSPVVYPLQRLPLIVLASKHLGAGHRVRGVPSRQRPRRSPPSIICCRPSAECRACHADRSRGPRPGGRRRRPRACARVPSGLGRRHAPVEPSTRRRRRSSSRTPGTRGQPCADCHGDMSSGRSRDRAPAADDGVVPELPPGRRRRASLHRLPPAQARRADGDRVRAWQPGARARSGSATARRGLRERTTSRRRGRPAPRATRCHDRSECVACHQGVISRRTSTRGTTWTSHVIDARRGTPDCSACHRSESFCIACHERSGVGHARERRSSTRAIRRAGFIRSGWSSPGAGAEPARAGGAPQHHDLHLVSPRGGLPDVPQRAEPGSWAPRRTRRTGAVVRGVARSIAATAGCACAVTSRKTSSAATGRSADAAPLALRKLDAAGAGRHREPRVARQSLDRLGVADRERLVEQPLRDRVRRARTRCARSTATRPCVAGGVRVRKRQPAQLEAARRHRGVVGGAQRDELAPLVDRRAGLAAGRGGVAALRPARRTRPRARRAGRGGAGGRARLPTAPCERRRAELARRRRSARARR